MPLWSFIMNIIKLEHLTKKYAPNVGCFDINIKVAPGEVYGFIGPNGAGKTTVIRQLMGFIKPDRGRGTIFEHDIWTESQHTMNRVGYLAGEVALPGYLTGYNYLKMMASLRPQVKWDYVEKLIAYFELDAKRRLGKLSKGNRQKVAIISAFMHKPQVLILDEPTSGLDPLMQEKFNLLIAQAKEQGATIFISSHIFGEIENTCDRVGFIKKGRLIEQVNVRELRLNKDKIYEVNFAEAEEYRRFLKENSLKVEHKNINQLIIKIKVPQAEARNFLLQLAKYQVSSFREIPFNLESRFLQLYEDEVTLND